MKFKTFEFKTKDAKKPKANEAFKLSRRGELEFQRALMKVARATGHIVERHVDGHKLLNEPEMQKQLKDYAIKIAPWASRQSQKLIDNTLKKLKGNAAYRKQEKEKSERIGKLLKHEVYETEVDVVAKQLFLEQVGLITSIPLEAGERAQKLAFEAVMGSRRNDEIAAELQKTTQVTESRAKLIARTETARSNTALNMTRATTNGSEYFVWRNAQDESVRPAHEKRKGKKLDGQVFRWDDPPTLDDGTRGLPGTFPNCRCYAEPVLPDTEF